MNANGNRVDVWLIYRCKKCQHTLNLTIHERVKPGEIPTDRYKRFLDNDGDLAMEYGVQRDFFTRNRAEIADASMMYRLNSVEIDLQGDSSGNQFWVCNPNQLPVREERILSEVLQVSRSQVKKLIQTEMIYSEQIDRVTTLYIVNSVV